jgi:DNA-binding NarL/FixJ family response regulator
MAKQFYQYEGEKPIYDAATGKAFSSEENFISAGGTPYWKPGFSGESNVEMRAKTPTAPLVPEASKTVVRYPLEASPAQTAQKQYYEGLNKTPPNESQIREDMRKRYQEQVDTINSVYKGLISREDVAGQDRLGQQRSYAFRAGVIGSPGGDAQKEKVGQLNAANVKALEDERAYKVSAIMGKVDEEAQKEIQARKEESQGNTKAYMDWLTNNEQAGKERLKGLAQLGIKKENLSESDFQNLLKQSGMSELEFDNLWNQSYDTAHKIEYQYAWKGNNMVAIGQDPITGKLVTKTYSAKDLNIPVGANPEFITNEVTGEMFYYDKDNPEMDPETGAPKLKSVGKFKQTTESELDKLLTPTEASSLGVPYGTTRGEAAEQGIMPKSELSPEDKINLEVKLGNSFETYAKGAREGIRQVGIINGSYAKAEQDIAKGASINAASQGVLVSFQKILDPTSVVRESEYARSGDGQSLLQRIEGWATKIQQGGAGVTEEGLKEFVDLGKQFLNGYQEQMLNYAQRTKTQADNYGLNLENILTPDVIGLLDNINGGGNVTQMIEQMQSSGVSPGDIVTQLLQDTSPVKDKVLEAQKNQYSPEEIIDYLKASSTAVASNASAKKIAEAIKTVESGGNYNAKGASGESGAYQFMPSTWKSWAGKYLGNANAPMTKINQDKVATSRISELLKQGYDSKEIALIWNGGSPTVKKGVNSYGVKYDTGAYANKVLSTLRSLA